MTETADSPHVVDYSRTFTFAATPEQVWAVLERFESLAAGCHWLRELCIAGGVRRGRGLARAPRGTRRRRSSASYRMRVEVIVDGCVPERCIDASVRGNLDGVARIAFQGDETETRAYMHVTPGMADDAMAEVASLIGWGRRDVR